MFCHNCGTQLEDGAALCNVCGSSVGTETVSDSISQPVLPSDPKTKTDKEYEDLVEKLASTHPSILDSIVFEKMKSKGLAVALLRLYDQGVVDLSINEAGLSIHFVEDAPMPKDPIDKEAFRFFWFFRACETIEKPYFDIGDMRQWAIQNPDRAVRWLNGWDIDNTLERVGIKKMFRIDRALPTYCAVIVDVVIYFLVFFGWFAYGASNKWDCMDLRWLIGFPLCMIWPWLTMTPHFTKAGRSLKSDYKRMLSSMSQRGEDVFLSLTDTEKKFVSMVAATSDDELITTMPDFLVHSETGQPMHVLCSEGGRAEIFKFVVGLERVCNLIARQGDANKPDSTLPSDTNGREVREVLPITPAEFETKYLEGNMTIAEYKDGAIKRDLGRYYAMKLVIRESLAYLASNKIMEGDVYEHIMWVHDTLENPDVAFCMQERDYERLWDLTDGNALNDKILALQRLRAFSEASGLSAQEIMNILPEHDFAMWHPGEGSASYEFYERWRKVHDPAEIAEMPGMSGIPIKTEEFAAYQAACQAARQAQAAAAAQSVLEVQPDSSPDVSEEEDYGKMG